MGAEQIAELEKTFASTDARVAETVPDEPGEQEESAASVDDADPATGEAPELSEGSTEGEHADGKHPKKKPGVHNRIGELTREKYEAKREADEWRAKFLATQQQPPAPPKQDAPQGAPTLEQFDYDQDKYVAARIAFEVDQRLNQAKADQQRAEAQRQQQAARDAFNQRAQNFASTHEDFFDVAMGNQALPITEVMAEYITASERGPEVAYHLGQHPAEAQTIAQMPAYLAGAALARLEDRLAAPQATAPTLPAQPAQITRAPPVASRVAAAAPGNDAMNSMQDHIAAVRAKQRR